MNMLANATTPIRTVRISGRHDIAFRIPNTMFWTPDVKNTVENFLIFPFSVSVEERGLTRIIHADSRSCPNTLVLKTLGTSCLPQRVPEQLQLPLYAYLR